MLFLLSRLLAEKKAAKKKKKKLLFFPFFFYLPVPLCQRPIRSLISTLTDWFLRRAVRYLCHGVLHGRDGGLKRRNKRRVCKSALVKGGRRDNFHKAHDIHEDGSASEKRNDGGEVHDLYFLLLLRALVCFFFLFAPANGKRLPFFAKQPPTSLVARNGPKTTTTLTYTSTTTRTPYTLSHTHAQVYRLIDKNPAPVASVSLSSSRARRWQDWGAGFRLSSTLCHSPVTTPRTRNGSRSKTTFLSFFLFLFRSLYRYAI